MSLRNYFLDDGNRSSTPDTETQEALEGPIALSTRLFGIGLFLLAILLVGGLFRWLQHLIFAAPPIWVVPTMIAAFWLYHRSGRWTGRRELRQKMRNDLENGVAEVLIIEPVSVKEVEEFEDEGPGYLIEASTSETIFLCGQEMEVYKDRGFPWSKFGVVQAPESKLFFGLESMGDPIPVGQILPPLSYETAKRLGCLRQVYTLLDSHQKALADRLVIEATP